MSLSAAQTQLLENNNIPMELKKFFADELGNNGIPKEKDSPDFLMLLIEQLQKVDSRLQKQRTKLSLAKVGQLSPALPEEDISVDALEEVVKQEWIVATALWRITDQVVTNPVEFGIILKPEHVQYAFDKKNLAAVEMIKYVKPEFFELNTVSLFRACVTAGVGIISGAILGLYGGLVGGAICGYQKRIGGFVAIIFSFLYGILGLIRGCAKGILKGGRIGFQTGHIPIAIQLGYQAAFLNPFNAESGTKYQQEEELKTQETLFKLAQNSI